MSSPATDFDVVVLGSGFGGSAAALRFSEMGERVLVLERGDRVTRAAFEADADMFWSPRRHLFGMNELRPRGRHVIPWLGAAVGGGSHVYAATLKRKEGFERFPEPIRSGGLGPWYDRAEAMLDGVRYPDWSPYEDVRAYQIVCRAERALAADRPDLVEAQGRICLGIAFAPPGGIPGATFVNRHGAEQRYSDPGEQKILGGDIGAKNSLDLNYLHLAEGLGAEIRPLCEADRVEPLAEGGWRVHYVRHRREGTGSWRRVARACVPRRPAADARADSVTARRVVVACGSVGSTELLLRNRDVHGTLPELSPTLGEGYSTNGDYVNLLVPKDGLVLGWGGFAAAVVGWVAGWWWLTAAGAVAYFAGLIRAGPAAAPDIGPTNSDYIRFRHRDGSPQGSYIEGGRYPTPLRALVALVLSVSGLWRPERYRAVIRGSRVLAWLLPPLALVERSWPVPLLQMGRDDAVGRFRLDGEGRARIDYPFEENRAYYDHLDGLARMVARRAGGWFVPNLVARLTKKVEVPHNLGGALMGEDRARGVVDHAGRAFGYDDLMVLDGSIVPGPLGPNPALTILALAERAMDVVRAQVGEGGAIRADVRGTAAPESAGAPQAGAARPTSGER